jgi:lipoprotein NlpI
MRDFSHAADDFQTCGKLKSVDHDYAHYWLWLIRARAGETEAATRELKDFTQNHRKAIFRDWSLKVGQFLSGELDETDFISFASNSKNNGQICEAWFYAGSKHLIVGDKTAAIACFEKCLTTNQRDYAEYPAAAAELAFIKAQGEKP